MKFTLRVIVGTVTSVFAATSLAQAQDEPEFNGRKATEWVKILKDDSSARKRQAAVVVLGRLWADNQYREAIPNIGKALLNDPSPSVRIQAATVLGQLKKEDIKDKEKSELRGVTGDLSNALRAEKDSAVRREIATVLGRYGELSKDAVGALITILKDTEAETRVAAVDALGRIGKHASSASPEILPMLKDSEKTVRQAAIFAIARIDPEDVSAVGTILAEMLKPEKDPELRRELVISLGLLGDHSEGPAGALAGALADTDTETRRAAVRSLGTFGPDIRPAVAALLKTLKEDKDKNVRVDSIRALGSGLVSALKDLIPELSTQLKADPDFEVRIAICDEFGALGIEGKDAVPFLREAQRDPQVKVREAAAAAIRRIEKPPAKKP